jgi:hypothetical protein
MENSASFTGHFTIVQAHHKDVAGGIDLKGADSILVMNTLICAVRHQSDVEPE